MMRILRLSFTIVAAGGLMVVTVSAQQIVKKDIPGISTFAQLETTIACGGSTRPDAIPELGRMGFKSVINLRLASEEGAQVEDEGIAVKAAGSSPIIGTSRGR